MSLSQGQDLEIIGKRMDVEKRVAERIIRARCVMNLDEIRTLVYEERPDGSFPSFVTHMLAVLNATDDDIDSMLPLIQDLWNYYPHARLGDRCPADLLNE